MVVVLCGWRCGGGVVRADCSKPHRFACAAVYPLEYSKLALDYFRDTVHQPCFVGLFGGDSGSIFFGDVLT
jgi:hypothetical protein